MKKSTMSLCWRRFPTLQFLKRLGLVVIITAFCIISSCCAIDASAKLADNVTDKTNENINSTSNLLSARLGGLPLLIRSVDQAGTEIKHAESDELQARIISPAASGSDCKGDTVALADLGCVGKAKKLGDECVMSKQCRHLDEHAACYDDICACDSMGYVMGTPCSKTDDDKKPPAKDDDTTDSYDEEKGDPSYGLNKKSSSYYSSKEKKFKFVIVKLVSNNRKTEKEEEKKIDTKQVCLPKKKLGDKCCDSSQCTVSKSECYRKKTSWNDEDDGAYKKTYDEKPYKKEDDDKSYESDDDGWYRDKNNSSKKYQNGYRNKYNDDDRKQSNNKSSYGSNKYDDDKDDYDKNHDDYRKSSDSYGSNSYKNKSNKTDDYDKSYNSYGGKIYGQKGNDSYSAYGNKTYSYKPDKTDEKDDYKYPGAGSGDGSYVDKWGVHNDNKTVKDDDDDDKNDKPYKNDYNKDNKDEDYKRDDDRPYGNSPSYRSSNQFRRREALENRKRHHKNRHARASPVEDTKRVQGRQYGKPSGDYEDAYEKDGAYEVDKTDDEKDSGKNEGVCACVKGYSASSDGKECVKKQSTFGGKCTKSSECDATQECNKKSCCECKYPDYVYSDYVTSKQLNEVCKPKKDDDYYGNDDDYYDSYLAYRKASSKRKSSKSSPSKGVPLRKYAKCYPSAEHEGKCQWHTQCKAKTPNAVCGRKGTCECAQGYTVVEKGKKWSCEPYEIEVASVNNTLVFWARCCQNSVTTNGTDIQQKVGQIHVIKTDKTPDDIQCTIKNPDEVNFGVGIADNCVVIVSNYSETGPVLLNIEVSSASNPYVSTSVDVIIEPEPCCTEGPQLLRTSDTAGLVSNDGECGGTKTASPKRSAVNAANLIAYANLFKNVCGNDVDVKVLSVTTTSGSTADSCGSNADFLTYKSATSLAKGVSIPCFYKLMATTCNGQTANFDYTLTVIGGEQCTA